MMNREQLIKLARQVEEQGQDSLAAYEQALTQAEEQLGESDFNALLGYLLVLMNGGQPDDQTPINQSVNEHKP